jgi:hypothetical protein
MEVAQGLAERSARMLIERLFRNPKTTLLGLILISLCFLLVFFREGDPHGGQHFYGWSIRSTISKRP